jgi:hypothetical protein
MRFAHYDAADEPEQPTRTSNKRKGRHPDEELPVTGSGGLPGEPNPDLEFLDPT